MRFKDIQRGLWARRTESTCSGLWCCCRPRNRLEWADVISVCMTSLLYVCVWSLTIAQRHTHNMGWNDYGASQCVPDVACYRRASKKLSLLPSTYRLPQTLITNDNNSLCFNSDSQAQESNARESGITKTSFWPYSCNRRKFKRRFTC